MKIEVEFYSGFKADERPLRFRLGETWHEVTEVLDQWYGPYDVYFKVRCEGSAVYILRRHAGGDCTLEAYRSA